MFPVRRCNIPNLHSAYFFVLFPLFLVTWVKTPLPIPQPGGRGFPVLLSLIASFVLNPWKLYWQFKILFHYLCSNSKMKNTKKKKKTKKENTHNYKSMPRSLLHIQGVGRLINIPSIFCMTFSIQWSIAFVNFTLFTIITLNEILK